MPSDEISIHLIRGDNSAIVSAPHGHDYFTAEIVQKVCATTGLCGLTVEHVQDSDDELRVNVNRPTEGAGREPLDERCTIEAAEAYADYLRSVVEVGRGRLDLYVEVHGNDTQRHVEVATVGLGLRERMAIKAALAGLPCGVLVEGIDQLVKDGRSAKQHGVFRVVPRGIQIEVPEPARETEESRSQVAHSVAGAILAVLSLRVGPTLSRLFRAG